MTLGRDFYARPVQEVARDLLGCAVLYGESAGRVVEVESYHESEPACHAFVGVTPRTEVLFGEPGLAYVYRSYGIHSLLNAVCDREGVGAAVLIRALEPLADVDQMRRRRGSDQPEALCSGPGKLTEALGIGLELNGTSLVDGPIQVLGRDADAPEPTLVQGRRVGITKAVDLPWRLCDADSRHVSRPWPPEMRRRAA